MVPDALLTSLDASLSPVKLPMFSMLPEFVRVDQIARWIVPKFLIVPLFSYYWWLTVFRVSPDCPVRTSVLTDGIVCSAAAATPDVRAAATAIARAV